MCVNLDITCHGLENALPRLLQLVRGSAGVIAAQPRRQRECERLVASAEGTVDGRRSDRRVAS